MSTNVGSADRNFDIKAVATALGVHKSVAEKRAKREGWRYTEVCGRGGRKRLYAIADLSIPVQVALLARTAPAPINATHSASPKWTEQRIEAAHDRYERVGSAMQAVARKRLDALHLIERMQDTGCSLMAARAAVAEQLQRDGVRGASVGNLARWQAAVAGAHRSDWLYLLVPHYVGQTAKAQIDPEAWETFKADYLRLEAPSAESCYRRLQRVAAGKSNWPALASLRTFKRRIETELSRAVRVLAREGEEALMKLYPAQQRDRSVFAALDGVNSDGHKFDVSVIFPDGTIGRPIIVGWQDLASGKMLSWRIGETETSDLVRLAFADMVREYGIPRECWLDNGRAFASKFLTGGTPNRYRFKVREEDPVGIITGLGVTVHWVTPYHGQAKPIERAWRDFCDSIAKHPAFAGAYLGNNPTAKPENYGSRSVAWDEFVAVVNSEVAAHNARLGRRAAQCNGRSFDQVFAESYAKSSIRKATSTQLRALLLAAEAVTANAYDGSVHVAGNRYWSEALSAHAGRKVVLRFDPIALHTGVDCYALDGTFIGYAECIARVGFADTNAAREHARATKDFRKATKRMLGAERRMDASRVAAQLPTEVPADLPPAAVIEPVFGTPRAAVVPREQARTGTDDLPQSERSLNDFLTRIQEERARNRL
ncbi:MAG: transposase domain-containing protein [Dokdonella sp.]